MKRFGRNVISCLLGITMCFCTVVFLLSLPGTGRVAAENDTRTYIVTGQIREPATSSITNLTESITLEQLLAEDSGVVLETNGEYSITNAQGMVNFAKFTNGNSTAGMNFVLQFTAEVVLDNSFPGIGSEQYPFEGSLQARFTTWVKLSSSAALFRYLSTSASVFCNAGSGDITIEADGSAGAFAQVLVADTAEFSLTDHIRIAGVGDEPGTIVNGFISADKLANTGAIAGKIIAGQSSALALDISELEVLRLSSVKAANKGQAGLFIGAVEDGVELSLNLRSDFSVSGTEVTAAIGNAGLFIGSLVSGDSVTVSTVGNSAWTISGVSVNATCGSAGGITGSIAENGQLTISFPITFENISVSAYVGNSVGGNGGGAVGWMQDDAAISLKNVNINGTVGGGNTAGGVFGYLCDAEIDCQNGSVFTVTSVTVRSNRDGGGYIGKYEGSNRNILVNYPIGDTAEGDHVTVLQVTLAPLGTTSSGFGGVCGTVNLNSGDALNIKIGTTNDVSVRMDSSVATTTGTLSSGGVVGVYSNVDLSGSLIIQGEGSSSSGVRFVHAQGAGYAAGGAIGLVERRSYFELSNLRLYTDFASLPTHRANIIGYISDEAVVRAGNIKSIGTSSGNMYAVSHTGVGSALALFGELDFSALKYYHTVTEQDQSLIYAEDGCSMLVGSTVLGDDIGNYGQIINNGLLGLVSINEDHEVSVHQAVVTGTAGNYTVNIEDATDFAAVAVTIATNGAINGITSGTAADMFAATTTYRLSGNIDLTNAGIESLVPVISTTNFKATMEGTDCTITLNIGAHFENTSSYSNTYGIFDHVFQLGVTSGENGYLGLVPFAQDATFRHLNIAGKIKLNPGCLANTRYHVGGFAAFSYDDITIDHCSSSVNIDCSGAATTEKGRFVLGGFIGSVAMKQGGQKTLSITNSTGAATITVERYKAGYVSYVGGFVGQVREDSQGNSIDFSSSVSSSVISYANPKGVICGGLVARIGKEAATDYKRIPVNLDGVSIVGSKITINSSSNSEVYGGLLGERWYAVDINIENFSVDAASELRAVSVSQNFGGLLYEVIGKITVDGATTDLKGTYTGRKSSGTDSFMVKDGTDLYFVLHNADDFAAMMKQNLADQSLKMVSNSTYKDYLVGYNINEYGDDAEYSPIKGALLTLENGGSVGSFVGTDSTGYMWYEKSAGNFYNANARYFCNVETCVDYIYTEENPIPSTINSIKDYYCWWLYTYITRCTSKDGLPEFNTNDIPSVLTLGTDLDLSGLCYYPFRPRTLSLYMNGKTITFNPPSDPIKTAVENRAHQMRMAQTGLFLNVENNLAIYNGSFSGNVLAWNGNSGFLVTGRAGKTYVSEEHNDIVLNLRNITLNGVRVDSGSNTPLMINSATECVNATFSQLKLAGYGDYSDKAGSSLIGTVGGDTAHHLNFKFEKIELDEYENGVQKTPFSKSILIYSLDYSTGSGSFTYNFNRNEDWSGNTLVHHVTYGQELYDKETPYYDYENYYVSPVSPTSATVYAGFTGYLPYVFSIPDNSDAVLNVNVIIGNLLAGFGTYENPYVITKESQLLAIWSMINSGTASPGWQVNYPKSTVTPVDCYMYVYGNNSIFTSSAIDAQQKTIGDLRSWMQSAYYLIEISENETYEYDLSSAILGNMGGLGTVDYPFSGVIIGQTSDIVLKMPVFTGATNSLGLIGTANGCAVKNLTVEFPQTEYRLNDAGYTAFGGVINTVIGGDNLIDSVSVIGLDGHLTVNSRLTFVGGYVGLIKSGGVIFRDITESGIPDAVGAYGNYFYVNPFVGRVLDGYACCDQGAVPNNTDRNYRIVGLNQTGTVAVNGNTYTIPDAETLWIFASAVNSGSLSYGIAGSGYSDQNKSRFGKYDGVGSSTGSDVITGGYITDDRINQNPYLLSRFGTGVSKVGVNNSSNKVLSVVLSGDSYDLSVYGNGFRGIGARYDSNAISYLRIGSFRGKEGGSTVQMNMSVLQCGLVELRAYTSGNETAATMYTGESAGYHAVSVGLINSLRQNDALTVSDLIISGTAELRFDNIVVTENPTTGTFGASGNHMQVGGVIGDVKGTTVFNSVQIHSFGMESPEAAGGIAGITSGTVTFTDCQYDGIQIVAGANAGGFCGRCLSGITVSLTKDCTLNDADLFVRVGPSNGNLATLTTLGKNEGAGSIAGVVEVNNINIGSADHTLNIIKIAAYYIQHGDYKVTKAGRCGMGGVIGGAYLSANKSCTFRNINIEDILVLGSSNYKSATTGFISDVTRWFGLDSYVHDAAVRSEVAKFISSTLSSNDIAYGSVGAGGIIGYLASGSGSTLTSNLTTTFDNVHITSNRLGSLIISSNASGGIIGDNRCNGKLTIRNCSVNATASDHIFTVVGTTRSGGMVGYSVGATGANVAIENVRVGNNSSFTYMFSIGGANQNMAGGVVVDCYACVINNVEVERVVAIAQLVGGVVTRIGNEAGSNCTAKLTNIDVSDCWLYTFGNSTGYNLSSAGGIVGQIKGQESAALNLYLQYCQVSRCLIEGATKSQTTYCGGIIGVTRLTNNVYGQWLNLEDCLIAGGSAGFGVNSNQVSLLKALYTDITVYEDAVLSTGIIEDTLSVNTGRCGVVVGLSESASSVQILGMHRGDQEDSLLKNQIAVQNNIPCTVVYTNFGFDSKTEGAILNDLKTKPENTVGNASGSVTMIGDGAMDLNFLNSIQAYNWWHQMADNVVLSNSIKTYKELLEDSSGSIDFSLFNLSGTLNSDIDGVLKEYLNFLTNDGFATWNDTGAGYTVSVKGYTVNDDGSVTSNGNGSGCLRYTNGKFVFSGTYDEIANGTFTVVTITFNGTNPAGNNTYSMDIPLYYKQILRYTSNLIVLGERDYILSDYLNSSSRQISVDNSSVFSVYMEYIYNEIRADFDTNLAKALSCSIPLKEGTKLTLIDLNSYYAADFKAYYYTLTEADVTNLSGTTFYIDFALFDQPTEIPQTALSLLPNDLDLLGHVTLEPEEGAERYLMIIELTGENLSRSDAELVTLKATTEKVSNIPVINTENEAVVTVWKGIDIELGEEDVQNYISTSEERAVDILLNPSLTYPVGYVSSMGGETYYGMMTFKLQNALGSSNIPLPRNTVVTLTDGEGNILESYQLTNPQYDVTYLLKDEFGNPINVLADNLELGSYHVLLDFSDVDTIDFNSTFESNTNYLFEVALHVSTKPDSITNAWNKIQGVVLTSETISKIKVSMNKTCDSLYFGVNEKDPEDITNSGIITFEIYAIVSGFEEGEEGVERNVMLRYVLKAKVTDGEGNMSYQPVEDSLVPSYITSVTGEGQQLLNADGSFKEIPISINENGIYNGDYVLKINPEIDYFANYMLEVEIFIRETEDGVTVDSAPAKDHLIYTVAKIQNILTPDFE